MSGTAWEADYVAYFKARASWLRRVAFTLCGDWHTADDLVQNTFLQLYRRWKRIGEHSVDAYARRVLVNLFLSTRRRPFREQLVAEVPDALAAGSRSSEDRLDLANALATLTPRQRAMVVLRYLEDLPIAEVAVLLGAAEGTVKSQTAKAVHHLRAVMGQSACQTPR
jgi:RNA polymerase sigma-70 factor (sigma-E family)